MAKVEYLGSLGKITGRRKEDIKAETVGELLDRLFSNYRDKFQETGFTDSKTIASYYQIMVDGRHINSLKKLDTELEDGNLVMIYPPVGGG